MASEEPNNGMWEDVNEEFTTTVNTAPFSSMSTVAPITQTSSLLPLNQLPVEKLQGCEDCEAWLEALAKYAKERELWKVITGEEKKLEDTDATKLQEWNKKDLCAIELISNSISQEIRVELEEDEQFNSATMTSNDLLGKIYDKVFIEPEVERCVILNDLLTRFIPLTGRPFASIEAFIVELMQEWTTIKATYPDTNDDFLKMVALLGLERFDDADDERSLF